MFDIVYFRAPIVFGFCCARPGYYMQLIGICCARSGKDKDKDNNLLGLSASLLAGEIASKDTSPLGPDDEVAADLSML